MIMLICLFSKPADVAVFLIAFFIIFVYYNNFMENINILQIGLKMILGLFGIMIFAGWKVREHLQNFDMSVLVKENKAFWIWTFFMLTMVLLTVTLSPESSTAIKTMIGLDIDGEPASFLSLGWGLSMLANTFTKKKLDKKKTV